MSDFLTRQSLLSRVRDSDNAAAWREFEDRYRELIYRYGRARGLQDSDADDVCQLVFAKLSKSLRTFQYDPAKGKFRSYLYRIVKNEIIQQFVRPNRATMRIDTHGAAQTADDESVQEAIWENEWENHHLRLAMKTIRKSFDEKSVQVFDALLGGASIEDAADGFAMTRDAVHKVKQRVRKRLQELIAQQIKEEDEPDERLAPSEHAEN